MSKASLAPCSSVAPVPPATIGLGVFASASKSLVTAFKSAADAICPDCASVLGGLLYMPDEFLGILSSCRDDLRDEWVIPSQCDWDKLK